MYAVIETGGKQYRVEVGTELAVELLDAAPGESITLDRVLLVADGDERVQHDLADGVAHDSHAFPMFGWKPMSRRLKM